MAAAVSEAKPRQLQVARIRREEDEELWISGEELYTEGSSDDDAKGDSAQPPSAKGITSQSRHPKSSHRQHRLLQSGQRHTPSPVPACAPPPSSSEPAQQDEPHLTETTRRLSQMGVEEISQQDVQKPSGEGAAPSEEPAAVEEQEEVILWRPKRGSIKLPHVDLELKPQQSVTGTSDAKT